MKNPVTKMISRMRVREAGRHLGDTKPRLSPSDSGAGGIGWDVTEADAWCPF